MAQSVTTPDHGTLLVPGAYPAIKVERSPGGLATSGVIVLVGEAEQGPDFSAEEDLADCFYRPSQIGEIVAKYGSGPLVDAARAAVTPSSSIDITGAPAGFVTVKTNQSGKASASFLRAGNTAYAVAADRSYGAKGNNIHFSVTDKVSEVEPSVGPFALVPPDVASDMSCWVNGTLVPVSVDEIRPVTEWVENINGAGRLLATGGENIDILNGLSVGGTLGVAVSGNNIVITLAGGTWVQTPVPGSTMAIPGAAGAPPYPYGTIAGVASAISGAGNANQGAYVITAATSTTISATKISNDDGSALTPPVAVAPAVAVGADEEDILVWNPVTIRNWTGTVRDGVLTGLVGKNVSGTAAGSQLTLTITSALTTWAVQPQVGDQVEIPAGAPAGWRAAGDANVGWYEVLSATTTSMVLQRVSNGDPLSFPATAIVAAGDLVVRRPEIDGTGKSLEIASTGTADLSAFFLTTAGAAVTWLSTLASPVVNRSSAERKAQISASRASDNVSGAFSGGGTVALLVGYDGDGADLTISGNDLTTSVSGGVGSNLSLKLSNFATIKDLADYINAQSGYSASPGTTATGQNSPTVLDEGTFGICGGFVGSKTGRIKRDAYDIWKALEGSTLLQFGTGTSSVAADSGLPENQGDTFLANGTKGSTTNQNISDALDACEVVSGNFVVPLFSRDAADDVLDDLTDAASSYTIDSVHALAKSHVLAMSEVKLQKNRQALCSFRGTFNDAKDKASALAHPRVTVCFQDAKVLNSAGTVTQFQPWMTAVLAAGMQSAGFYRAIVKKAINASGFLQAAADFDARKLGDKEEALAAGLLFAEQDPRNGGYRWVSDQTTYLSDNNFVYNSLQAVYAADLVALTVAQELEAAFVGQSLADVTAGVMAAYFKGIASNLKRLKLIAASDGAEAGYRNLSIQISGPVAYVSVEIFLATALYFIPINIKVVQVESSATSA